MPRIAEDGWRKLGPSTDGVYGPLGLGLQPSHRKGMGAGKWADAGGHLAGESALLVWYRWRCLRAVGGCDSLALDDDG